MEAVTMKPRILLVDDDALVLQSTERALSRAGYIVTPADDAILALHLLETGERYEVIVSDLEMPRMHGDEFCLAVQKLAPTPVILCSGSGAVFQRGAACGAAGSFLKPVPCSDLKEAIDRLIQRRPSLSPTL